MKKLVFMGTPDFAVPVLKKLVDDGYEIGYVLTQPDRKRNRGKVTYSPVKELALENEIPVLQPERLSKDEDVKAKIREYKPDAIIVVAYGQILKQDVLDIPEYGCFNVHGSILPKLRGASPIQHAILEGLEKTGITVMKMGPGLDDGDMISTAETPIERMNSLQLQEELSHMGAELLSRTLPSIFDGTAVYTRQDDEKMSYAGMISKNDGRIDFSEDPEVIERRIRAFNPWPGVFFERDGQKFKIWAAECPGGLSDKNNGTVLSTSDGGIDIACNGKILRVTELQVPGKKRTRAADYLRGHSLPEGSELI